MRRLYILVTSVSNQMVVDHGNMKASVPDVDALSYGGEREEG